MLFFYHGRISVHLYWYISPFSMYWCIIKIPPLCSFFNELVSNYGTVYVPHVFPNFRKSYFCVFDLRINIKFCVIIIFLVCLEDRLFMPYYIFLMCLQMLVKRIAICQEHFLIYQKLSILRIVMTFLANVITLVSRSQIYLAKDLWFWLFPVCYKETFCTGNIRGVISILLLILYKNDL